MSQSQSQKKKSPVRKKSTMQLIGDDAQAMACLQSLRNRGYTGADVARVMEILDKTEGKPQPDPGPDPEPEPVPEREHQWGDHDPNGSFWAGDGSHRQQCQRLDCELVMTSRKGPKGGVQEVYLDASREVVDVDDLKLEKARLGLVKPSRIPRCGGAVSTGTWVKVVRQQTQKTKTKTKEV